MLWLALSLAALLQGSVDHNLVENLRQLAPNLDEAKAEEHIQAARAAATTEVDTELLLAIAYVESHYDPLMTSRVEDGNRKTGAWRSVSPAGTGNRFCGVLQTQAGVSWKACLAQRSLLAGYSTGATELRWWLRYTRGDLSTALSGYGCGLYGVRTGKCNNYAERVLARRRRLVSVHVHTSS